MKERMRRIICCAGTAGIMAIMSAVPAMAETTKDDWSDKVAANVLTYANIREQADVDSSRVGTLASGAVATVVGIENGWIQISSGEVEGYIREDLVVAGEEARSLHEALYGEREDYVEAVSIQEEPQTVQAAETALEVQDSGEAVQETTAEVQQDTDSREIETDIQNTEAQPVPQETEVQQESAETSSISTADLDLMAAIIECEAGGESYEGKIGVGAVIMNRIRSGEFPDSLSGVIYQSGQFEPVWTGKLDSVLARGASEACYAAARDVFAGANTIGDRLFFHAGSGNGLTIGNQTFY